jgi:hypothetical protein
MSLATVIYNGKTVLPTPTTQSPELKRAIEKMFDEPVQSIIIFPKEIEPDTSTDRSPNATEPRIWTAKNKLAPLTLRDRFGHIPELIVNVKENETIQNENPVHVDPVDDGFKLTPIQRILDNITLTRQQARDAEVIQIKTDISALESAREALFGKRRGTIKKDPTVSFIESLDE